MRQAHGFLVDCTEYYIKRYSTRHNRILMFLCAHYNVNPLQNKCDGSLETFSVRHVISSINKGIVIACQNEILNEIIKLIVQAFSPACIHGKPIIHQGRSRL